MFKHFFLLSLVAVSFSTGFSDFIDYSSGNDVLIQARDKADIS
ncbi:hypothetical protein [Shouchella patagoniensis]|nr:hypothetical protein [Shouchella patagoniensis]